MLATTAYAIISALQRKALEGSLDATRESNKEAERNNEFTRGILRAANRATVTIEKIGPLTLGPGRPQVAVTIVNSGVVPATNIRIFVAVQLLRPDDKLPPAEERGKIPSIAVLRGHGGATKTAPISEVPTLSPEDVAQIKAGRLLFYIWGRIIYKDGFGDDRTTGFCAVHEGNTDHFRIPETGNWIDKEEEQPQDRR